MTTTITTAWMNKTNKRTNDKKIISFEWRCHREVTKIFAHVHGNPISLEKRNTIQKGKRRRKKVAKIWIVSLLSRSLFSHSLDALPLLFHKLLRIVFWIHKFITVLISFFAWAIHENHGLFCRVVPGHSTRNSFIPHLQIYIIDLCSGMLSSYSLWSHSNSLLNRVQETFESP